MSTESSVDVLIIGAGPAGLMCGYNLAQAGFNVRIVDRRSERLLKGQGDAVHPRGTEILESLELGHRIRVDASRVYKYTTYKDVQDGKLVRVNQQNAQTGVNSPFNYLLMTPQATVEGIFRDAMGSGNKIIKSFTVTPEVEPSTPRKLVVEQNTHPTDLSVSDNPAILADPAAYAATVTLEGPEGKSETVKAKYVLGCDGAHSWTRSKLGIDMVGDNSDNVWGLVDSYIDTNFPDHRTLAIVINKGATCAVLPREHNLTRFSVQIDQSEVTIDPETGRIDRVKITAETIKRLVKKVFDPYYVNFISEPDWWGVYVIGQRLASAYSTAKSRVFLVGDACHTHSPHAGQGMNAAMGDGHNLSWKLIHVLRGWANKDILSTYEFERRGFAMELMELDKKMAAMSSGKIKGNPADLHIKSTAFVAGVGVKYGESQIVNPLNQELAPGIPVGVRFPHQIILRAADCWPLSTHDLLKSDLKYKLLIFTGDALNDGQTKLLEKLSESLSSWLEQSAMRKAMIQIYTIMRSKKDDSSYTTIPAVLRSAWDTVFIDDVALTESNGGGDAYKNFGIGDEGCVVLVRPDAYVAGITSLDGANELDVLFERIFKGV